jgi:hypothetical protein
MATDVQICNMALSHIGFSTQIASVNPPDGSVEAGRCAVFYAQARRELIELKPWTFATRRAELAPVTNVSKQWCYAYELPSDCLRPYRLEPAMPMAPFDFNCDVEGYVAPYNSDSVSAMRERESPSFEIDQTTLYTNIETPVLVYSFDPVDPVRYPPLFVSAFSLLLGAYLAGASIRGTEGAALASRLRELAVSAVDTAAESNANWGRAHQQVRPSGLGSY